MLQTLRQTLTALATAAFIAAAPGLCAFGAIRKTAADLYFRNFTTSNSGLSFNSINTICEDSIGFVWIGSSDGLNRFDGTKFRTFHKEDLGLNSSYIVSLYQHGDRLWIGTDNGVAYYDYTLDVFEPFTLKSDKGTDIAGKATVICGDRIGNVWFAVNEHGIFKYEPKTERLFNYFQGKDKRLPANTRAIYFGNDGECLLSLYFHNLYRPDWKHEKIEPVKIDGDTTLFANDNILGLAQASDSTIYAVSVHKGLVEFAPGGRARSLLGDIAAHEPQGLSLGADGSIWLPTMNGLYLYSASDGCSRVYNSEPSDRFSLSDSYILSVIEDSHGGLWCGTFAGGLNYSDRTAKRFKRTYLHADGSQKAAKVHSVEVDRHGNVWCATAHGGLLRTNAQTGTTERFMPETIPSETFDVCLSGDELWVSALTGIFRIEPDNGRCRFYDRLSHDITFSENKLVGIRTASSGDVLVLTPLGVFRYDMQSDSFTPFRGIGECYVTDMAEDDYGHLWLSTFAHGLICYDPENQRIVSQRRHISGQANSLPTDKLLSVMVDNNGRVWAGTFGSGIIRFDTDSTFTVFDRAILGEELTTDVAYQILQDKTGKMWATTSSGLLTFDPESGRAYTFRSRHGLLNEDFASTHGTVTHDGTFYLCSADGYISFRPQLLKRSHETPQLIINSLSINGQPTTAKTKDSPIKRAIDTTGRISLAYWQTDIAFDISDLMLSGEHGVNVLNYRLRGYDNEWRKLPPDGHIAFQKLPAGDYLLEFERIRQDDNGRMAASQAHAPLQLHVAQIFYKTKLAWLLYSILAVVAISLLWQRIYRRRIRRAEERQRQAAREQEIEAYNEKVAMISFVANRLRAPLALIRNPLTNILRSGVEGQLADDLMVISNGADKLSKVLADVACFNSDNEQPEEGALEHEENTDTQPDEQTLADADAKDDGDLTATHRIMLIEPAADMFSDIKENLKSRHRVLVVRSADVALELMQKNHVDLLLIPDRIKSQSAASLCETIGASPELQSIPVVVVSQTENRDMALNAVRAGALQVITPPYTAAYVEACIDTLLRRNDDMRSRPSSMMVLPGGNLMQLSDADAEFLKKLDTIVMENIGDSDFSNEQLAKLLFMSKSTLMRRMKSVLETTPKDYILDKRLVLAAEMLKRPSCRVNEVCYAVGFNTPSYFAKCFKRAYGVLPSEYRDESGQDNGAESQQPH